MGNNVNVDITCNATELSSVWGRSESFKLSLTVPDGADANAIQSEIQGLVGRVQAEFESDVMAEKPGASFACYRSSDPRAQSTHPKSVLNPENIRQERQRRMDEAMSNLDGMSSQEAQEYLRSLLNE